MVAWLRIHGKQLLIGVALAALPLVYFVYQGVSWRPLNPHEHIIQNGLAYLLLLLFSYYNHTVFVPRWFLAKQYGRYTLIAVCCVLTIAFLPYRIEQWAYFKAPQENTPLAWARQLFVEEMMLEPHSGPPDRAHPDDLNPHDKRGFPEPPNGPHPDRRQRDHHGPPFTLLLPVKLALFFLLGSVSTLLSISVQTANRLRQVENDQLKAELQQLKAQIHPHFLFNTLNSIYSLAIRNDERTADTIVKLSEFMRYIIRDAHRDKVPLSTEVNYIANYIDLQKARLRDAVQIDYQLEGDQNRLQIAPLLLFSFIENAFKYGVSPEEDSLIIIHLSIQDERLRLYVANNKVDVNQLEKSTTVGLKNARERLRLLYPNAHELVIEDTPMHYRVTLTLTLS
ncbi:sensor histidine kinase [Spirosoma sp. HMF4905]|uniref:Sensor histidine kinase n=1 Tax=Spirosoma arboris TaxID=2682092 RepID=A0A7K1SDA7_9BACT|nr:sensor histidine kinase [Spirosoma arboris]MVM31773.1 sensor histidine kinase [Spirosoma arboris]